MSSKILQKIIKKKKTEIFLYVLAGLIILLLAFGFFLSRLGEALPSIYVYPENPKQGDSVFIRIRSDLGGITGNLKRVIGPEPSFVSAETLDSRQDLIFYKKDNSSEWVSLFGIDADQPYGNYKISVNVGGTEITKEIKISTAEFSVAPAVKAPSSAKTGFSTKKAVSNIRNNDNPVLGKVLGVFTAEPYFRGTFSFPLKSMQATGYSFGKFIGFAKDKLQHFGVDLRAFKDTDIYSINDGKVVLTASLSNYGKTVIIDHGLNIFSLYLHLDEFKVLEGQMVGRGQIIGLSGDTGYVTAPHLHFSMRVGGARVDPIEFIKTSQKIDENFFLADISQAFLNLINKK